MTAARWLLLLLLTLGVENARAAGAQPQVRASIAKQEEIWVGQRLTLVVELLTPGTFASAPSFDLPRLTGIILIPPSESPTVGSETIEENTYTTQRHELRVFVQRAGTIEIPSFTVRFASSPTFVQPAQDQTVHTKPIKFTAKMPPGADGLALVITTTNLTVSQSWDPQPTPEAVKLGAAFTRTITTEATDIPAMVLPSFSHEAPPGLGVYPRPPTVEDKSNRGVTTGRRVDAVTFVCESSGTFDLPTLAIVWWDPQEHELKHVELPGQRFEVAAAPPSATAESSKMETTSTTKLWIVSLTAAATIGVVAYLGLRRTARSRRTNKNTSEAAKLAELERACQDRDPHQTLAALYAWIDQICPSSSAPTIADIAAWIGDDSFAKQADALESVCYGNEATILTWSAEQLWADVMTVRHRLRRIGSHLHETGNLPPLNP